MDPVVDVTVRVGLALLWAVAAAHKLRDLPRFRATVAEYRLVAAALVAPVTIVLVAAEVGIAAALVVPAARVPALVGAAALLLVYTSAIGVNLARGRRELDCGCAGPATRRPISGWLVGRNVTLAAVALLAVAPVRPRPLLWVDVVTVAGGILASIALHAAFERLLAQEPALARLRGDV